MTDVELIGSDVPDDSALGMSPEDSEQTYIDDFTQRNYRIWKKNTPFLYDYLSTNSLLWPSLTVQFFPDRTDGQIESGTSKTSSEDSDNIYFQRLLHGTFSLGSSVDSIQILQVPVFADLNRNLRIDRLDFNSEKQEFELATSVNNKFKVLQKINHMGDVNKVRYMPQKPNIIASANNMGDLAIYERTKHKSFKNSLIDDTDLNKVQVYLKNSNSADVEGTDIFAIDWNKQKEGTIVSASMNGEINLYDIRSNFVKDKSVVNESWYYHNESSTGVNDIEWLPQHDSLFSAVDDAGFISLFDTREESKLVHRYRSSEVGVNSISVNPGISHCIATGDSNGSIHVYDIRGIGSEMNPIYSIQEQTESITQLKWHPRYHNVLGSSSTDHSVKLFDLENSSSLLFAHAGHMLGVNDFDWSHHDDWMVASVSDDNSLHVWKPSHTITRKYNSR
ncbi:hypothetical protein G9P44_002795 [Scheffersomyces stipitis]|nr:hypothetical protein G9P44_002795 [Scheffersomyces stipitis]